MRVFVALFLIAASFPLSGEESSGFLETDHAPLSEWLDERFDVEYKNMTPALIFDQAPLNDIHYETKHLPQDALAFNFSSDAVSRRDLLSAIADYWNLSMSFSFGDNGNPDAVIVKGAAPEGDNGF